MDHVTGGDTAETGPQYYMTLSTNVSYNLLEGNESSNETKCMAIFFCMVGTLHIAKLF